MTERTSYIRYSRYVAGVFTPVCIIGLLYGIYWLLVELLKLTSNQLFALLLGILAVVFIFTPLSIITQGLITPFIILRAYEGKEYISGLISIIVMSLIYALCVAIVNGIGGWIFDDTWTFSITSLPAVIIFALIIVLILGTYNRMVMYYWFDEKDCSILKNQETYGYCISIPADSLPYKNNYIPLINWGGIRGGD